MSQAITPDPTGDTAKQIEDKTRALPANQGLNDFEMWAKVDTEITEATSAGTYRNNDSFKTGTGGDSHGKK